MKAKGITLVILLAFIFTALSIGSFSYAGKVKVIEGLIEDITEDSVRVNGMYYYIKGVPIKNSKEKKVSKDWLKIGRLIQLFYEDNILKDIIVYDELNMGG